MFDIEVLKEMKLSDLQEIAKAAKINKYRSLKKDDLVYQILDLQAAKPEVIKSDLTPEATAEQPKEKRARILPKKEVLFLLNKTSNYVSKNSNGIYDIQCNNHWWLTFCFSVMD